MFKLWTVVLSLFLMVGVTNTYAITDTIPSPPESVAALSGPIEACVGDISVYTAELAIGCDALWYVESVLQSTSGNLLEYSWVSSGSFLVELEIACDTINFSGGSIMVTVDAVPNNPSQIIGDKYICMETTSYYNTMVGDNETCQWKVDDIIQTSDSSTISYYWYELGNHIIEVRAINQCGIGYPTFLNTQVFDMPEVFLGNDTTIFVGQNFSLNAGNPGCNYLWSTGDTTQAIIVSESGNYGVVVINPCGQVSDEIFVDFIVGEQELISDKIQIRILNGILYVEAGDVLIDKIQIFNSTGILLNESTFKKELPISQNGILIIKISTSKGKVITHKINS